jgi:hypothetical protein
MKTFASLLAIAAIALAAPPAYKIADKIKVGGEGGWDYVYVDSAAQRLYASHATKAVVIDLASGKVVGRSRTPRHPRHRHSARPGPRVYQQRRENTVTIFDSKTLKVISKVMVPGKNRIRSFTSRSRSASSRSTAEQDATSIDAKSGMVLATFTVDGKPEFSQVDGKGHIYVNNEDKAEIYEIDAQKNCRAQALFDAPCEAPSGLALDNVQAPALLGLRNKLMIVSNPDTGKVLAMLPIGAGADGCAFDDGYAYSSNGVDGNMTIVGETSPASSRS